MLKDKELLQIEADISISRVRLVGDADLLPYGFGNVNEVSTERWLRHRKVPKNRQFANEIIATAGEGPYAFLNVSYGLSLNDAYWVKPGWLEKTWDDVNLYKHPFDKILSNIAFTGYSNKLKILATSPEYTTNGMLKKSWSNREDGIFLIKGRGIAGLQNLDYSFPDGRSEVFSEYYAAQIAAKMGIPHVDYDVEEFHHKDGRKEYVSVCKLFTSENVGYVPFSVFAGDVFGKTDDEIFTFVESMIGKERFADIMVLDSVIYNQDRHLGNFGVLVDNDTKKVLGAAPVFDNGASLFCGLTPKGIENLNDPVYGAKPLECVWGMTFDKMAERFLEDRHRSFLQSMKTFTFVRHPKYNIKESSLQKIEMYLQGRARDLLDNMKKKPVTRHSKTEERKFVYKRNNKPRTNTRNPKENWVKKKNVYSRDFGNGYFGQIIVNSDKITAYYFANLEKDKAKWESKVCKTVNEAKSWCVTKDKENKY